MRVPFLFSVALVAFLWRVVDGGVRVAVVEYAPTDGAQYASPVGPDGMPRTRGGALDGMMADVERYGGWMAWAADGGSSLVVFPEYGLTGPDFPARVFAAPFLDRVPDPVAAVGTIPCDARPVGAEVLVALSCAARRSNITAVADLGTAQPCKRTHPHSCPADGQWQFN